MEHGDLEPDFGPRHPHPSAGGTLVTARPPLVAFNVELEGASLDLARQIAAKIRESGGGLDGVRAIGLELAERGVVQVSTNVHDPFSLPLRDLVEAIRIEAERDGASVAGAELVGLAPAVALEGLPDGLLQDFDPQLHILENRVATHGKARAKT
jgi:glutamate formiminotransferase